MALVAIEFEENRVYVAAARTAGRRVEINHLFSLDLDGDDETAGERLKSALSKNGCSRADAIIVVSRANAEMREVVVPPAPTSELPEMVRFIARNEFASMNDNWAFDFVPLSDDPGESRKVIAAAVSPELKTQMTSIAEAAGLRIKHMVLRPYSAIDLIRSKISDQQCRLIIDPNGDKTDMTLVQGTKLVATRTVLVPSSHESSERTRVLIAEAKRTIASSRKALEGEKIASVVLFDHSEVDASLKEELTSQLVCEVEIINPLALAPIASGLKKPTDSERYVSLMGALVQQNSTQKHLVDFVNPRRPIATKRDMSKVYLYGGLALATMLLAIGFGWWTLSSEKKENEALALNLKQLIEQNEGTENRPSVENTMGEVGVIDGWVTSNVDWLEEIYQFSERSLTADETIVDLFDAHISTRKAGDPPTISVKSKLASVNVEKDLLDSLGARPFRVSTDRGGVTADDDDYELASNLTVKLVSNNENIVKRFDERASAFIEARNKLMMDQEGNESGDKIEPESESEPAKTDE